MLKLLADEQIAHDMVTWLRQQGCDVLHAAETLARETDLVLLQAAQADGRVVLTEDKDFGELVFRDHLNSHGIILLRLGRVPIAKRIQRLQEVWSVIQSVRAFHCCYGKENPRSSARHARIRAARVSYRFLRLRMTKSARNSMKVSALEAAPAIGRAGSHRFRSGIEEDLPRIRRTVARSAFPKTPAPAPVPSPPAAGHCGSNRTAPRHAPNQCGLGGRSLRHLWLKNEGSGVNTPLCAPTRLPTGFSFLVAVT